MTDILGKTPTGFDDYGTNAVAEEDNVRKSIQDINHDGNLELVLSGPIGFPAYSEYHETECDWPLIFAWNGSSYAEVSSQYKPYYVGYLDSLNQQMGAKHPRTEELRAPTPIEASGSSPSVLSIPEPPAGSSPSKEFGIFVPPAAPAPLAASTPEPDLGCERIEAAKAEAFLGIHSDTSMSAAIKDSESKDPRNRMLAAVILSYVAGPEAKTDLKTLANDSEPKVAKAAKEMLSGEPEPSDYYREVTMEQIKWPPAKH